MSFELPPELWLRIFERLPWSTIPLIHQVSRSFAALSYGLLLEEFHFQPRPQFMKKAAATLAPKDLERLAFWTTERISEHVRRCIIILKTTSKTPAPIVQAFSRFSNLQHLTLMDSTGRVELQGLGLGGLPYLRSLDLAVAQLVCPNQPPSTLLQLEYLSYIQYPPLRPISRSTAPMPSLSAVDPAALRHLRLYFLPIHVLKDTISPFTNLHALEFDVAEASAGALYACACISPLSALRVLTINVDTMDVEPKPLALAASTLSHLHTYTGPAALLQLIIPHATPLNLTLDHTRDYAPEVLSALQGSGTDTYPSVTNLSFQVQCHDIDSATLVPDILARLPRLTTLSMAIRCHCASSDNLHSDWDTPALSSQLARLLGGASALETLELLWQFNAGMEQVAYSPVADNPRVEDVRPALSHARVWYPMNFTHATPEYPDFSDPRKADLSVKSLKRAQPPARGQ
ncbi:hypothetical protein C8R47DRAFT_1084400 [Mycena vitilis]|nr:hypothetical protein C8R47DRAFT_1084400 [Mycena vitilis]